MAPVTLGKGEDDDAPLDAVSASVGIELVEVRGAEAKGVVSRIDVRALPLDIDDDVAVWGFNELRLRTGPLGLSIR